VDRRRGAVAGIFDHRSGAPLLLTSITGSAAFAGTVAFVALMAGRLMSVPAGVWVDRHDVRRVLLLACGSAASSSDPREPAVPTPAE
jgi:MFS family permease